MYGVEEVLAEGRRWNELRSAGEIYPRVGITTTGPMCSAPPLLLRHAHLAPPFAAIPMTDVTTQEDWDPGRRQDVARPRTDRRRLGWREFRRSYPGLLTTMTIAVIVFLAIDGLLISRYRRYQRETRDLRAAMSDVERKRTDEILAQNENRLKVMVELFKRQAKVDPSLHLSVSLDSGVMYLQREGALLREMPITVGPERRVGTPPDTVHIAAPRGKRTVEQVLDETDVWDVPAWVYTDRGLPPGRRA